ncbi:PepSY-associated TM helix domain-containing protein [Jonesia quinghaiensis]|uniref:PepSY-associated TM helix domain-containing protein n=1 Tax=Jonesia quinghaiensis TaxID=262806 RepID=UPI000408C43B|nr:PepSY-associated TM helix domain-containing protein [Jonesia quinghaiensis]
MPTNTTPWLTPLLQRLHFYAGILIGPFILIAALSGTLYALATPAEKIIYADILTVEPTGTPLPLAQQTTIAQQHINNNATLKAIRPAPNPTTSTRILFTDPTLGDSESRTIFINPYTGDILADTTTYGTSGALPIRTWISSLHRNLHLGEPGRLYSELAASWLGIVALAGAALWVTRIKKTRQPRTLLIPQRNTTGYRRWFTWHASTGIWVLVGALFLATTGITWSTYAGANISELRSTLNWSTPSINTALPGATAADSSSTSNTGDGATPDIAAIDDVLAVGQQININTGLVEIKPPTDATNAWVIQEIQRSYPTEVDAVAINGTTLNVTDRTDFSEFPLAAKLTRWGVDLHMGTLFGLPNAIALAALALGITAMVIMGYIMWWKRRPRQAKRYQPGKTPGRGALRTAPWWGVALTAGFALAVGWFLPLVGYTLIAFLAIDVVSGFVAQRQARPRDASATPRP